MTASTDKPAGWEEPVYEAIVYPEAFFGARPRNLVIGLYAVAMLAMIWFSMRSELANAFIALVSVLGTHVFLALLGSPRGEPFWASVLGDWFETPPNRIEP